MMGAAVLTMSRTVGIRRLSEASKVVVAVVGEFELDGAAGVVFGRFTLIEASPALFKLPVAASIASKRLITEFWRFWG
jgi:hypothetical protein